MDVLYPIFVAVFAIFFFLILHFVIWQLDCARNWSVILIAGLSIFTYLITICTSSVDIYSHIWVSCPLYMFVMMLYLQFYMGIDRSVSIRILGEILKTDNKRLDVKELDRFYSQVSMIQSRLDLLVNKGFLREKDGKYVCTRKGAFLAWFAILTRKVYSLTN